MGMIVCKACWKKETANRGGICTGCLNTGRGASPRPYFAKPGPKSPDDADDEDDEPVTLADLDDECSAEDEDDEYREYTDED